MKLIIGLGNPGKEYINTRHNVGFMAIDRLCSSFKEKFNGLYGEVIINGEKVMLLKPLSYMNLSGEVVIKYIDYYNIDIDDILVICDDLDMDVGRIRLRSKGSSGGHNGLKNIILHLGTDNFKRLKIGISNKKDMDTKDYVLGKFSNNDKKLIDNSLDKINDIVVDFVNISFEQLMNKYN